MFRLIRIRRGNLVFYFEPSAPPPPVTNWTKVACDGPNDDRGLPFMPFGAQPPHLLTGTAGQIPWGQVPVLLGMPLLGDMWGKGFKTVIIADFIVRPIGAPATVGSVAYRRDPFMALTAKPPYTFTGRWGHIKGGDGVVSRRMPLAG
jgi:hypothetical protein